MRQVLVSIDGSGYSLRGVRVGQALAAQTGLPLKLYSVVRDPGMIAERRSAIRHALEDTRGTGDRPDVEVVADASAASHLARLARDESSPVLCMTTHGRRPAAEAVLGSVTAKVVRESARPVVLVGPDMPENWQGPVSQLIVCIDGSPLSEAVLTDAIALARTLDARLMLLHAVAPDAMASAARATQAHGADLVESSYVQTVARRLKRDQGIDTDWDVLHGKAPADAIAAYPANASGTMIMMATHGRSGLGQVVMGSVAHSVVHRARCPVVVVRPSVQT